MSTQLRKVRIVFALLCLVGLGKLVNSAEPLTPRFKEVVGFTGENNPVDLLPRLTPPPVTMAGVAKPRLELNGTWRFHSSPAPEFWKNQDETGWSDIQVPGEWVMQGFRVKPRASAGYRLRFEAPADWAGRRVKLRFDAVYSKADVWLNGMPVGSHLGAFTPFELDVTQAVLPGKENLLALAVASDSLADALTVGLEMAGHPIGGILRKVSLFVVPEVNVSSLHVETTFDRQYQDAVLRIFVNVVNESTNRFGGNTVLQFSLREHGPDGASVNLNPATWKLSTIPFGQVVTKTIEIPIKAPKKWDAEHPHLYVLTCDLQRAGCANLAPNCLKIVKPLVPVRETSMKPGAGPGLKISSIFFVPKRVAAASICASRNEALVVWMCTL